MQRFSPSAVLVPSVLCAAALLFTPTAPAQATATAGMGPVAHEEAAMWDDLRDGRYQAMKPLMAADFVYVGPEAISSRDEAMEGMKTCKLNNYAFHDAHTRMVSPEIALVTYVATIDTVCGPQPFKGDVNCSSLWVHRNGQWIAMSHTETMTEKH